MKTFNYADFKQRWLTRCKELSIDPAVGPLAGNQYQIVLIKAEARIERQRRQAGWWGPDIHGRARDTGDVAEEQSTWNFTDLQDIREGDPDDWDDSDFTVGDLWLEIAPDIRDQTSPAQFEAWRESMRLMAGRERRTVVRLTPML